MGAANCGCKGVSKECLVTVVAGDDGPAAPEPPKSSRSNAGGLPNGLPKTTAPLRVGDERNCSGPGTPLAIGLRPLPPVLESVGDQTKSPAAGASSPANSASSTVSPTDPDMVAKMAAYKRRKSQRAKRNNSSEDFQVMGQLSDTPEVDDDVPFRFVLEMWGLSSEVVVASACHGQQTFDMQLPLGLEVGESPKDGDPPIQRRTATSKACLVEVSEDVRRASKRVSTNKQGCRLAKLTFRYLQSGCLPECCKSASEAEASAAVFIVDTSDDKIMGDELSQITEVFLEMSNIPCTRRPMPAIILCGRRPDLKAVEDFVCAYERDNGRMLRYGPVDPSHGNSIHEIFSKIVNLRMRASLSGLGNKQIWKNVQALDNGLCDWPLVDYQARPTNGSDLT